MVSKLNLRLQDGETIVSRKRNATHRKMSQGLPLGKWKSHRFGLEAGSWVVLNGGAKPGSES